MNIYQNLSYLGAGLCVLLLFTCPSQAEITIGFNFVSSSNNIPLDNSDSAGVVSQQYWNDTDGSTNGNNTNLEGGIIKNWEGDTVTGMTVSWSASTTDDNDDTATDPHDKLMAGFLRTADGTDAVITVSNIPANWQSWTYYVIAYFGYSLDGRDGTVSDGTDTYYFDTDTVNFEDVDDYSFTDDTTNPGPPANYAQFAATSASSFTITVHQVYGSSNYVGFHGLQMVAAPEPGSIVLLAAGGAFLLLRRRRKRLIT